jgi:hypothetical protein
MDGDRVAVVVNGRVEWITRDHRDHDSIVATWLATYGSDPYDLGDIILFRIEPASMWTFALHPDEFPEH